MTSSTSAAKKERHSRSTRAGILFPVGRMHRLLKGIPTAPARVTKGASVYLASVIEYLVGTSIVTWVTPSLGPLLLLAELLELSGNAARDYRRRRLIPRHILLAIGNDEELNKVTVRETKEEIIVIVDEFDIVAANGMCHCSRWCYSVSPCSVVAEKHRS